jgi:hypothetical protein
MIKAKLSKLVQNQFPEFYKEDGQNFLAFIEAYYDYLEEQGKLTDAIQNIEDYRSIDTTLDEYIDYFQDTFLPSVPHDVLADKKILAKYVKFFNETRGTLSSYKLLFRSIYNEDVEVNYPADQMLKVSEGDWKLDRYLVTNYDPKNYTLIGRTVEGTESSAQALVEDVVGRVVRNRDIMQIIVSKVSGSFNHLEPIRILGDTSANAHTPIIEAGIESVEIINRGGEYKKGDLLEIISDDVGDFGKVVITDTIDLNGSITFRIDDGGSGYTSSIYGEDQGETQILITGGDGQSPASFTLQQQDIGDTFALAFNTNLISGNNIFGSSGPLVTYADTTTGIMDTFANTLLSSPSFGFPEQNEVLGNKDFRDNSNAVINIVTTGAGVLSVGDSIFGGTSGANGIVTEVVDGTAGDAWFRVDTYKRFTGTESVKKHFAGGGGTAIGTVSSFQSNTVGGHALTLGVYSNTHTISEGDELVSKSISPYSNDYVFGVVKKVINTIPNGYDGGGGDVRDLITFRVTANTTANVSSQFETGPMASFISGHDIRKQGSTTTVATVSDTSSNTVYENIYTKLEDSLLFKTATFGTIEELSNRVGGSGFTVAPKVQLIEPNISSLGIGEQYITIQSNDQNWLTGNSSVTGLDTNDRLFQANTGARGDIKAGGAPNQTPATTVLANGTFETTVRVWQDFLQRDPGNIIFKVGEPVRIDKYDGSYVPGGQDQRTLTGQGSAKVVSVVDKGVLGKNAVITPGVGANGTAVSFRIIDSGYSYSDGEVVRIQSSGRDNSTQAVVRLDMNGTANSQGYYSSSRSHISSKRGFIQDSKFYQEYSYQVISPLSLDRYKEVALKLVHPAGQTLFGKYQSHSNVSVNVSSSANNSTRTNANGTVALANNTLNLVGTGTEFTKHYANGDLIIIETSPNKYIKIPLNIVSSDTLATTKVQWSADGIAAANIFYTKGTIS